VKTILHSGTVTVPELGERQAGMYILMPPMIAGGLLMLRAWTSFERDARKAMTEAARG